MPLGLSQSRSPRPDPVHGIERLRTGINPPGRRFDPVHIGGRWQKSDLVYVSCFFAQRPKLSDGGHEARRLQPRQPAAVRCSAWLGHTSSVNLIVNTSLANTINLVN